MNNYNNFWDIYIKKRIKIKTPDKIFDTFADYVKKNSLILDIGCGAGIDSKELFDRSFKVIGIDNSRKMIRYAKINNPNLDFLVMDLNNVFFSKKINSIWCRSVLQQYELSDLKSIIKSFRNDLKKEGILYFSIPIIDGRSKERFELIKTNEFKLSDILNIVERDFQVMKIIIEKYNYSWYNFFCKGF